MLITFKRLSNFDFNPFAFDPKSENFIGDFLLIFVFLLLLLFGCSNFCFFDKCFGVGFATDLSDKQMGFAKVRALSTKDLVEVCNSGIKNAYFVFCVKTCIFFFCKFRQSYRLEHFREQIYSYHSHTCQDYSCCDNILYCSYFQVPIFGVLLVMEGREEMCLMRGVDQQVDKIVDQVLVDGRCVILS